MYLRLMGLKVMKRFTQTLFLFPKEKALVNSRTKTFGGGKESVKEEIILAMVVKFMPC